ncbi:MAG TPA: baseplate J/gp47 family protein [Terriglobales bacterium]|nr:baseplate J/gp47 family protein [Terriglobales bacterium]
MSYAAEPYAQFVDDLLTSLTGGIIRQQFLFLKEEEPYRLSGPGTIVPTTVRVFGQADGAYRRFVAGTDYKLETDLTITWLADNQGDAAAGATWPDEGTTFYANFEVQALPGAAPPLTDRNPGSIVRLLAESFAREYAVLSRQLEAVYRAGFLDTATGRDLEQLCALVGVTRRQMTFAGGAVIFGRSTPAPADIFIPSGTRLSTTEPPAVMFETSEDQTLRRGNLSVEVSIQAMVSGSSGVVAANTIRAIHRPILGIETVANPLATRFAGENETDEALRSRARRALEGAGKATTGAVMAALTTIQGVREKDVRISEDAISHPGVVKLNVALPTMSAEEQQRTVERLVALIEETRPVGVRILHNIAAPRPSGTAAPGSGVVPDEGPDPAVIGVTSNPDELFLPVDVKVQVAPATRSLTPPEKAALESNTNAAVRAYLDEAGIGEILVYNRLVSRLMGLEGVLDVVVEMWPQNAPSSAKRKNLVPDNPGVRPVAGVVTVEVGGSLVMLDVTVAVALKGAGLLGDPTTARAAAQAEIEQQFKDKLPTFSGTSLTVAALKGLLTDSENYNVLDVHYKAEYTDAGLRIHQQDVQLTLTGLERLWVRKVSLSDGGEA